MAQRITRTLPDGDYPTRLSAAYAAFVAAREDEKDGKSLPLLAGEEPASLALAREYEALKEEAEADAREKRRVVTLEAVGRRPWRDLKEKYPPRTEPDVDAETAKGDRLAGLNTDAVGDDLVFASVVEPEFTSRAHFDEWLDKLAEGEYQLLLRTAWDLANVASYDPKSLPPSATLSGGASST